MSITRNNHYVPQMYLQQWGTSNKVYVYNLLVSNQHVPIWTQQSISRTASMPNLYTRMSNGNEFDDFEVKFNTDFETPAKIPLQKACNNEQLTSDDWTVLIDFILAQYVRTPMFYHISQAPLSDILKSVMGGFNITRRDSTLNATNAGDFLIDETKLIPLSVHLTDIPSDNNHVMAEIEVVRGKNMWLLAIASVLGDNSPIRADMHKRKWSIVTSCNGMTWPTSDSPLVVYNPLFPHSRMPGLEREETIFIFPISPTKAIISKNDGRFPPRWIASETDSDRIKRLIINNAGLYVYSKSEDMTIPNIRAREVNPKRYKEVYDNYQNWYDNYKTNEAIFL